MVKTSLKGLRWKDFMSKKCFLSIFSIKFEKRAMMMGKAKTNCPKISAFVVKSKPNSPKGPLLEIKA